MSDFNVPRFWSDTVKCNVSQYTAHNPLYAIDWRFTDRYINVLCVGGGWEIIIDILNIAAKLHFDR